MTRTGTGNTPDCESRVALATRFFELVLAPGYAVRVSSRRDVWKGRAWEHNSFWYERNAEAAARWTMEEMYGVQAHVAVRRYDNQQVAAVARFPATATPAIACSPLGPTLVVVAEERDELWAAWIFSETIPWYASNLSNRFARRLGGSATARLPVPGTAPDYGRGHTDLVVVTGIAYQPEFLERQLSSMRRLR